MNTSTIRCPKPKYDNGCQYFCSWQVGLGNEYIKIKDLLLFSQYTYRY